MTRPYKGTFPVVPTTFTETGELDLESQKRCIDFMIDAGSTGLCILANFSEQFSLSDDEREVLTRTRFSSSGRFWEGSTWARRTGWPRAAARTSAAAPS